MYFWCADSSGVSSAGGVLARLPLLVIQHACLLFFFFKMDSAHAGLEFGKDQSLFCPENGGLDLGVMYS